MFNVSPDPNTDLSISLNWEEVKKHPSDILNLAEQICEDRKIKMVICMDEFQDVQFYDDPISFQKKLRSHWQHHKNVTYCLYGSKRHMMMDIFNNSSMPFYRFGDLMFLDKIGKQKWMDFIHKRFRDKGKEISLENAEEIALLMDGHPFFIQQLSQQAWFLTQKQCNSEIIDEAVRYLLQQYHFVFQKEVDQLTNPQINFLKAMLDDIEQFTSSEVLKKYKLGTAGNVKRIREALENKEIIDTSEQKMSFQDPIFKLWVKRIFLRRSLQTTH